ncbi:MAG: hypothetical protein R3B07_26110 [Polyangiaceae bacterium]
MTTERTSQLRVLALVMLPIALFLERGVYYQFRAAFAVRAIDAGATSKEFGAVLAIGIWVGVGGYVVGGLLSLVRGHLACLIGLGIAMLGYLLMSVAPSGWAAATLLVSFGAGCTTLGFYAAVARACSTFGQRVGGVALLLVASNIGGFIGPLGATATRVSPWLAYVGLLPVLLSVLLAAVDWWMASTWERTHLREETSVNWAHAAGVTAACIAVAALTAPIDEVAGSALFQAIAKGGGPPSLYAVGTLVTVVGALVGSLALGLTGLVAPRALPPAPVFGSGLLCAGLGGGIGAAGGALGITAALWVATFFGGLGTTLVDILLLAFVASALSRRYVGLGLLVYFAVSRAVGGVLFGLSSASPDAGTVLGALCAGGTLLLGVVVLVLSKVLSAWLVKEPEAEPTSA